MRNAILAFFALGLASAQSSDHAASLVREAADLARSAKSWRAEGHTVVEIEGPGTHTNTVTDFRLAYAQEAPARARNEISVGALSVLRVCDGASQWTYVTTTRKYAKVANAQISACTYPLNEWPALALTLQAATEEGADRIEVNGAPRDCQSIRADFSPAAAGRTMKQTRALCIDPATKLVLRYRIDRYTPEDATTHWSQTTTFRVLERDAALGAELFQFAPPVDAIAVATVSQLGLPASVVSAGQLSQPPASITPPKLIHKVEPEYTKAASKAHIQGTVVLTLVIAADGKPRDIRVRTSLDPGLDQKAIEAVQQWQFAPGRKDGEPVAVTSTVEVSFRLLSGK
jgi:TonB family protein